MAVIPPALAPEPVEARSVSNETILAAMVADASRRIAEADKDAHKAQAAFAAGKFQDYFDAKHAEVAASIQANYDTLFPPAEEEDSDDS